MSTRTDARDRAIRQALDQALSSRPELRDDVAATRRLLAGLMYELPALDQTQAQRDAQTMLRAVLQAVPWADEL